MTDGSSTLSADVEITLSDSTDSDSSSTSSDEIVSTTSYGDDDVTATAATVTKDYSGTDSTGNWEYGTDHFYRFLTL